MALALGLRQGEALGLKWSGLDLDARSLVVRRADYVWPEVRRSLSTTGSGPLRNVGDQVALVVVLTVLLLLGVPERAVMGIMGWSHTAMAARYQHSA